MIHIHGKVAINIVTKTLVSERFAGDWKNIRHKHFPKAKHSFIFIPVISLTVFSNLRSICWLHTKTGPSKAGDIHVTSSKSEAVLKNSD